MESNSIFVKILHIWNWRGWLQVRDSAHFLPLPVFRSGLRRRLGSWPATHLVTQTHLVEIESWCRWPGTKRRHLTE